MFTHYSDHTGRFIFEKSLYKLDVLWGIIHFERMAWVYNSIHLIAQMLAIFVTYSNSYKVVRRDFESALFFNVVLLLLAAIIEGSLTQYQSAKRLFLWTICICSNHFCVLPAAVCARAYRLWCSRTLHLRVGAIFHIDRDDGPRFFKFLERLNTLLITRLTHEATGIIKHSFQSTFFFT